MALSLHLHVSAHDFLGPGVPFSNVQAFPMGQETKLSGHISNQDCVFSFNISLADNIETHISDLSVISQRSSLQVQFLHRRPMATILILINIYQTPAVCQAPL